MKVIDINNWPGKKHYLWFKKYPIHYYGLTSELDLTTYYHYIKKNNIPFFISFLYIVTKALNQIEEFHLRVINDQVIYYEIIHPAYTIMTDSGIFDNCENDYDDDYNYFYQKAYHAIEIAKKGVKEDKSYNDLTKFDQFYITSLPWVDFNGVTHPMPNDDSAYVPRIAWGKYQMAGDKVSIHMNIHVSHALVDGYPLSKGFMQIQAYLNHPEDHLK